MAYTNGPWTAYTTAKNGQPKVAKVNGRTIAAIPSWSWCRTFEEDLANAHLIAAAPDLLAACKAIEALAHGQGRANLMMVAAQARAAISKATEGREP